MFEDDQTRNYFKKSAGFELHLKVLGADLQLEEPPGLQPCSGSVWVLLQTPALVVLWALRVHLQGPQLELLW